MTVIKLLGTPTGLPTEHDGEYVVEYDPTKPGGPFGHLVTSPDKGEALKYDGFEEAVLAYRAERGTRPDGDPDRPLTALTASFEDDV